MQSGLNQQRNQNERRYLFNMDFIFIDFNIFLDAFFIHTYIYFVLKKLK